MSTAAVKPFSWYSLASKWHQRGKPVNDPNPVDVGTRIRDLRTARGFSLRALAGRCGLSVNAISRIERGESSPTVSSLLRLAGALNVHIKDFFDPGPEQSTIIVRRGQGLRASGAGAFIESLGVGLPAQILEPFLMTIEPGAFGLEEPCQHPGEEFVHCLQGAVEYQVGEAWHRLAQGDSLLFLAEQAHLCKNTGPGAAVILIILASTGQDAGISRQQHLMTFGGMIAGEEG
jgi:transcriptional regulator with XRE-family HTH domain